MTKDNATFVLGAPDPEMTLIAELLSECGVRFVFAYERYEQRCSPRTAYGQCYATINEPIRELVLVECEPEIDDDVIAGECVYEITRIDHHRPGDPGYGKGPREAVSASSLGQVIAWLAAHELLPKSWDWQYPWTTPNGSRIVFGFNRWLVTMLMPRSDDTYYFAPIPARYVVGAAADHCLGEAYAGHVPGVNRHQVLTWREECATTRPHAPIEADRFRFAIDVARKVLLDSPLVYMTSGLQMCPRCGGEFGLGGECVECDASYHVRDLRSAGHVAELPDAASFLGHAYLTEIADRDGRRKIVIGGRTEPAMVKAFIDYWAPRNGLTEIYGDPARGFAGGYAPQPIRCTACDGSGHQPNPNDAVVPARCPRCLGDGQEWR